MMGGGSGRWRGSEGCHDTGLGSRIASGIVGGNGHCGRCRGRGVARDSGVGSGRGRASGSARGGGDSSAIVDGGRGRQGRRAVGGTSEGVW